VTTTYQYDGLNPVMLNGTRLMLEGLGIDQYFARINSGTATSFLTDALGSTIALTDSTAATTAAYAYGPYGNASATGSDSTPFQFTGRENDGAANLYYFRARYYNPTFGQFISADPAGLAAGINPYAYVRGNPISNADPLRLWSLSLGGYAGPGAEISLGVDDGHFFFTTRVGFGLGVVAELNPNSEGGIAGGTKSTGCKGGVVLSVSAKGGVGLGPLFNLGIQAGGYNNFASNVQNGFVEPEGNIINLESEVVLANEAFSAYISPIGAQITFYRGSDF
jgi:RHS repeat-associated protein